jgi:hypothetical protein
MFQKSASEVIASNITGEVVDFAIECNREVARLTKELDALKASIRATGIAQAALSGQNSVDLPGEFGVAQVVLVKAAPKAKKGVDLLASEPSLPAEVWGALFTKKVVVEIADDFEARVASLPAAQKAVVQNLVEVVAGTPRVNLPK